MCVYMEISKKKIGILFILLFFISIVSYSISTYQTAVLGQIRKYNELQDEIKIEEESAVLSTEEQDTLNLINEYRKQNGLDELKAISSLQKVAKIKAEDLVNNNYFSHDSPNLGTPFEMLKANEVDYTIAGENLAGNINADKAVKAWINSTAHRENILESKFEYTGICVIESKIYGKVFVQLFIGIN